MFDGLVYYPPLPLYYYHYNAPVVRGGRKGEWEEPKSTCGALALISTSSIRYQHCPDINIKHQISTEKPLLVGAC